MKAMTANDTCYSTIKSGWAKVFNTDGLSRDRIDVDEARGAFAFNIEKRQSYDEDGNALAGHFHLRRDTDGAFIPCPAVGSKFEPVQHGDVFDFIVKEIMPEIPDMKLETVGTIHGAGTGIVSATVGREFSVRGDKSPQETRLFFLNPCGRGSLVLGFNHVRLFCENRIAAARRDARKDGFTVRHTSGANIYAKAALTVIREQAKIAQTTRGRIERLGNTPITRAMLDEAMERIYPNRFERGSAAHTAIENKREEVMFQFEGGDTAQSIKDDTAWKLFNAFTYPIFNPERMERRMDRAQIAYAGAVGSRAAKVNRILDTVERITVFAA